MTEAIPAVVLGAALDAVENKELPLLAWGVVDSDLSDAEFRQAVGQALQALKATGAPYGTDQVVDALIEGALVIEVGERRWRSRFAETLRLLARSRQLFSVGAGEWWLRGRRLVADYRVFVQPRRYPRRDVPQAVLFERVQAVHGLTELGRNVVAAQLGENLLAGFQVDATAAVLDSLGREGTQAVIVAAGTGSGKTLAFYLPAYLWMSERLGGHQVHTLALYPRKELLKDQVAEALRAALAVAPTLAGGGRRQLRIGALYGDTPWSGRQIPFASWLKDAWRRVASGHVCPYCRCPDCGGDLIWPDVDRAAERERLVCAGCSRQIPGQVLALTRDALRRQPPDLLFTTTEMLNRASSDPRLGSLFGFTPAGSHPRLLLLDEVHTYQGVHGAQVALLLRRWRNAVGAKVTVVGLSATLADASVFMSRLVGIPEADVRHVEPAEQDLVDEGRQYQVALRGDPTSGASMLSVTIQASMLLGRSLDLPAATPSLAGSKGFLFTDDLDVTNRLFHDLTDAEGSGWTAKSRPGALKVLANLRSAALPDRSRRDLDGQVWALADHTGHDLPGAFPARGLRIGKTSSQDPGVADDADLVVATASLDVGFNDPRVGLVLQHKSPRDPAQFVQRRGRAGRTRDMRPLTVVVLSDFGRDRFTYQAYDRLFDPELPPRTLPVGNRYVVRMQATLALADWLTRQLQWRYDARKVLTPKTAFTPGKGEGYQEREQVAGLLEQLLTDPLTQREFAEYLRWSLHLDDDGVLAVLWDPPRALFTAVVPTLLRRVRSNWVSVGEDPGGTGSAFAPEFVPRALFAPLNLPEVELLLPPTFSGQLDSHMLVLQALREAAPGRVSKRFAVRSGAQRTWVPVPLDTTEAVLPLRDFVERGSIEGRWADDRSGEEFLVVRPYAMRLAEPPPQVTDTTNSRPSWRTQVVARDDAPSRLDVPEPWAAYIRHVAVHTHANRHPLQVRRFTPATTAHVKVRAGRGRGTQPAQTRLSYVTHTGQAAALGFALDVDGLRLRLRLPDRATLAALPHLSSPSWHSVSFRHAVSADEGFEPEADSFLRVWLGPVFENAVALRCLTHGSPTHGSPTHDSLPHGQAVLQACAAVTHDELRQAVVRLTGIVGDGTDTTADMDEDENEDPRQLRARLLDVVGGPGAVHRLREHAQRLYRTTEASVDLARQVLARTVGAAVHTAVLRLTPDADDQDILLDVRVDDTGADLWLTESTVGGAGVIENIVRVYAADPRRFWRLVWSSLNPGDFEIVDGELRRLLTDVVAAPAAPLAKALAAVRKAGDNAATRAAFEALLARLDADGYLVSHPVVSAIAIRLLRPGTGPRHDAAMLDVLDAWDEATRTVGFEIDARTWSSLVLGRLGHRVSQVYRTPDQVYSSLWPRGVDVFDRELHIPAPYDDLPPPVDRHLAAGLLVDDVPQVAVTGPDWRVEYERQVTTRGAVDLVAPTEAAQELQLALLHASTVPIDTGYLFVHPLVRGARRAAGRIQVRLELREVEQ